jgi:trehalose/maltose transport system permease protein
MMNDAAATKRKDMSEPMLGALLLLPAALLLLLVVVYPIGTLFWTSLHSVDQANPQTGEQWVGFANYLRAFDDTQFWHATWQTAIYIVVTVPGALVVGLGLALLANQPFKIKWPVRLSLLLPWALPLVFAGLIFRWFFEYQTGIVNDLLARVGIEPLSWLSDPTLATVAICVAIIWKASSFMALMLLAGLQTIPKSLYEAAEVDGASRWQQFVEITLPMLRPAIFVALIFRTITAIQTFDIPYAMTGGGPGDATETLAMYIRKTTLDFLDFGYGSALATLMFILSLVLTTGYLKYTRRSASRSGED